jgi:hypothetical protein
MYRKSMVTLLLFLIFFGCTNAEGQIQKRALLIFCDVTSSLDVGELTTGARLAATIIQNAMPPVRYKVVPIMLNTDSIAPVLDEDVPPLIGANRAAYRKSLESLPAYLEEKLKAQYVDVNNGPSADPNRSCIINSLERAAPFFNQYRANAKELDLVIISDMIEECRKSPYQQTIQLNRADIRNEIKTAQEKVNLPNLAGVRVILIIPSSSSADTGKHVRPPVRQLKEFWEAVFSQAGFPPASMQNYENFYFGSDLPDRYRKPW